jgi:hypothetical protein
MWSPRPSGGDKTENLKLVCPDEKGNKKTGFLRERLRKEVASPLALQSAGTIEL